MEGEAEPAVVEALARLGLLAAGRGAALRPPDRRGLVRHLAGRSRARPGLRQAGAGQAAGRRRLARADRAQRLRGRLDAPRRSARAGCRARAFRPGPAGGRAGHGLPAAGALSRLEGRPARGPGRARGRGRRRRAARRDPRRHRARCRDRRRLPDRSDLSRHPPRALSRGDRTGRIPTGPRRCTVWSSTTAATRHALVHGDVSPKNILVGPDGPVLLDAECAWYGDPAFDLAFCLNHLLLKCLAAPAATAAFLDCFDALAESLPRRHRLGASRPTLEARAAHLLPGLLLGRVDGKSPVEYLTEAAQKETVRTVARRLLDRPVARLDAVRARLAPTALPEGVPALSDTTITAVRGRRVWDSRGRPTVEAEVASPAAPSAARSRPPAPRPARARRSTAATAGPCSAATTSAARSPRCNDEIGPALAGLDAGDQAAVDRRLIALDGTADKIAARRQRLHRDLARRGAGGGRRRGPAALAPSAARRRHPAAAGDPDLRRRRPCRPAGRHPGLHDRLPGRRDLRRGAGVDRRGLPRRRPADGRCRQARRRRRRGRLLAGVRHQRGSARRAGPGDRAGGPAARARRSRSRSTSPPRSSAAAAAIASASKAASSTATA